MTKIMAMVMKVLTNSAQLRPGSTLGYTAKIHFLLLLARRTTDFAHLGTKMLSGKSSLILEDMFEFLLI